MNISPSSAGPSRNWVNRWGYIYNQLDDFTRSNLILLSKSLGFVLSVGDIDKVPDGKFSKSK